MSEFVKWLEGTFGKQQLEKFQAEKAAEVVATRAEILAQIRKLETDCGVAVAELTPQVKKAEARKAKAMAELIAAGNSFGSLYRRRAAIVETTQRDIAKLRARIPGTNPALDALEAEVETAAEWLADCQILGKTKEHGLVTGFFASGTEHKYFSNAKSRRAALDRIGELRREVRRLRELCVDGEALDAELASIRERIPTNEPEMEVVI